MVHHVHRPTDLIWHSSSLSGLPMEWTVQKLDITVKPNNTR
ncbi:unnamed protein product [Penicillium camemberti]|uniref:Str. FM013 n=1 Tax=Penicillium camemberti (strain FM 013) TaxID=1429867 RepID=A0A0G4NZS1_PENC3|nr:unnamed protein product [Penicillium camemberti]